ncbi:MAG: alpha/beta hydrolase [Bradymonadales bacterium]|nr:alpha/beta hydrolase [Bradymonadales bacterium]
MQEKTIRSFDGTEITYQVGGTSGRWLVVANGYGGTFCAWREVFDRLQQHYRLLLWDYRGLFSSRAPEDRTRLRIEDNCRDLDLLMECEGIERMVLAGWSVGVQVALEQYRRRPEKIEALILINGAHGRVLHRSLDGRLAGLLLPPLVGQAEWMAPWINRLVLPPLRRLARTRWAPRLISLAGFVNGQPETFQEALQRILTLDAGVFARMVRYADQHDTEDLLSAVAVPTLVTSGSRDRITRPKIAKHIGNRIPGAVHVEFPGGTHYSVMEFPDQVAAQIHRFLQGVGE